MDDTGTHLDLDDAALLVIDAQKAFTSPDGSMAQAGVDIGPVREVVPALSHFVDRCRGRLPTVFVRAIRPADGSGSFEECFDLVPTSQQGGPTCRAGTVDVEYAEGIEPGLEDHEIEKRRYDAFRGTGLDAYLRDQGIGTVVLTGFLSDVCVESTARSALELGYDVAVVEDRSAALDPDRHAAAIGRIDADFGRTVSAQDVLDAL